MENQNEKRLQAQLDHPFYKRTDDFRNEVKFETLKKAAKKYPEPFNPASWSDEQLAWHAMAENYDQSNYINGMYERMIAQEDKIIGLEKEIERLKSINISLKNEAEYWRLRTIKGREWELKYKIATSSGDECARYQLELKAFYEASKGIVVDERV